MSFADENAKIPKVTLNKVSSQASMFDGVPKRPTQADFEKKIEKFEEKSNNYKIRAGELFIEFKKSMEDKTLVNNKNIYSKEVEKELLQKMINLSMEINNDPEEKEGMGSLSLITLLLATCFSRRDKINKIEYSIYLLEQKVNSLQDTK